MTKLLLLCCAAATLPIAMGFVVPSVLEAQSAKENTDIMVTFPRLAETRLANFTAIDLPRSALRGAVREHLLASAQESQRVFLTQLDQLGVNPASVRSFWITDAVFIRAASPAVVALADKLGLNVAGNSQRATLPVLGREAGVHGGASTAPAAPFLAEQGLQWNILQIGVDEAWQTTKGEGVVVASIDTGVTFTHEALVGSYRGNNGDGTFTHDYNWHDPLEFQNDNFWCPGAAECKLNGTEPFDVFSHGTHTAATAVGSEASGVGVAPGAKWIGAKGCRDGGCFDYGLLDSAEFVMCPFRIQDPSTADCSQGADIVSNSWGGSAGDLFYIDVVQAWRAAGMIPVFSTGNSGPQCGTVGSPGGYSDVIAVGSTDSADSLSEFSSRGEGWMSKEKPDFTAPGEDILSALGGYSTNPDLGTLYGVKSGTSMAAPHVTGVIALLLSVDPSLTYDGVVEVLTATTALERSAPNNGRQGSDTCGGIEYTVPYSYHYGNGIVNAAEAVQAALKRRRGFSKEASKSH